MPTNTKFVDREPFIPQTEEEEEAVKKTVKEAIDRFYSGYINYDQECEPDGFCMAVTKEGFELLGKYGSSKVEINSRWDALSPNKEEENE